MRKHAWAAAPFAVWMTLFTVIPLIMVVWFALTDSNGSFTLANIAAIGDYTETFLKSILVGLISTVLCLVLAYPLAYSISRRSEGAQRTMVMIVMLPMWMNFLLRTYAWQSILEDNGLINTLLRNIGLLGPTQSLPLINNFGAIVLGTVYNFLPFMVLPLYSVMVKIDSSYLEAAQDLGSGRYQTFRRVILPLSTPGIVSGITMVFVPAVSTFVITKLLGGSLTKYIGDTIEDKFIGQSPDFHVGAALSLVLMILILICMAITGRVDRDDESGAMMA